MTNKIRLFGSYGNMLEQLAAALSLRAQLDDRDIGSWIGYPVGDYAKAKNLGRKLYIQCYSVVQPPWRPNGKTEFKRIQLTVPEPTKATCANWEVIKNAVGGTSGYRYGRFRTTVTFEGGRQSVVLGYSEEVSQTIAANLCKLSSLKVVKIITTETLAKGVYAAGGRLEIKPVQIFPGSYYVLEQKNWKEQPKIKSGKPNNKVSTLTQDVNRSKIPRIALWTKKPPTKLKEYLDRMFSY